MYNSFCHFVLRQRCVFRRCANRNKKVRAKKSTSLATPVGLQIVEDENTTLFNDTQNDTEAQSEGTNDLMEGASNLETVKEAEKIDTTEEAPNNEIMEQASDMIYEESIGNASTKVQLFKCSKCDKSFSKRRYAILHCKTKKPWKCPQCSQEIQQVQNIKRHIRRCNEIKTRKQTLTTPTPTFKCDSCDKIYLFKYNLVRHKQKKHYSVQPRALVCNAITCPFTTSNLHQLKRHQTVNHSSKQKLHCNNCDLKFLSASGLKKHVLTMHRVECDSCFDSFANEKQLEMHKLRVHVKDIFSNRCDRCPDSFANVKQLEMHKLRMHSQNSLGMVDENGNRATVYVSRVLGEHGRHVFGEENTTEPMNETGTVE